MSSNAGPGPSVETIIDGRYKLLRPLGKGTVGEVYQAEHLWMHKTVAIKLLRPEVTSSDEAVKRFAREARLASLIEDVHCVNVHDFAQAPDGTYYLAMEYLEGESLFAMLRREGKLSLARTRSIFVQLLDALGAAHKLGIVHRDMKPENIMLLDRGEEHPFVKILDFGIAKNAAAESNTEGGAVLTQVGFTVGTPEYMSPEQATAVEVDGRADLYSTGVMLFEAVTGRRPFVGSSPVEVATAHVFKEPPRPRELNPELAKHEALEAVILRALQKEAGKRFASAKEFAKALRAAIYDPEDPTPFVTTTNIPALSPNAPPAPSAAPVAPPVVQAPSPAPVAAPEAKPGPREWALAAAGLVIGLLVGALLF